MFPVSDGFGSFIPPPPRFSRVPFFPEYLAHILSLLVLNASSPSVSMYSADPLQRLFTHRPSVRKLPTLRLTADQCTLLVSCTASHMQVSPPPRPVRLEVLGLGVGGGAKETPPPAMVLIPSTRRPALPGLAYLRQRSSSLFDSCSSRVLMCV